MFNKTGTLTIGAPELPEILTSGGRPRQMCCDSPRPSTGCMRCPRRGLRRSRRKADLELTMPEESSRRARPGNPRPRGRAPRGGRKPRIRPRRWGPADGDRLDGIDDDPRVGRGTHRRGDRRSRRRRDRDGRRAPAGRGQNRRTPASGGSPTGGDAIRRPSVGRRTRRPPARRRPRLRRAVARGQLEVVRRVAADPELRRVIMVETGSTTPQRSRSLTSGSLWARPAPPSVRDRRRGDHGRPCGSRRRRDPHRTANPSHRPQSIVAGIGLSIAAMSVAALGYLPPLAGACSRPSIWLLS